MADGVLAAAHIKRAVAAFELVQRSWGRVAFPDALELVDIAETVEQPWPRLDGERPSEAHHWADKGFSDPEVLAWLEAGVPWATSAAQLRDARLHPRDVARLDGEVTLGLRFARGEMALAEIQRAVLGEEMHT